MFIEAWLHARLDTHTLSPALKLQPLSQARGHPDAVCLFPIGIGNEACFFFLSLNFRVRRLKVPVAAAAAAYLCTEFRSEEEVWLPISLVRSGGVP